MLRDVERRKIPDPIGMFAENCSGEVGEVTRLQCFDMDFNMVCMS